MPGTVDDSVAHVNIGTAGSQAASRAGLVYGLSAYTMWGVFPLYFHALSHVSPLVVLCHRIFWSSLFLGVVVSLRGEWSAIRPVLKSKRNMMLLSAGAVLIA